MQTTFSGNQMISPRFDLSQMTMDSWDTGNRSIGQLNAHSNPLSSNKIVPMDIDCSQEEPSYANDMDVEVIENNAGYIKQDKYQDFHTMLKRRNINATTNLDNVLNRSNYEPEREPNGRGDIVLEPTIPSHLAMGSRHNYYESMLPDGFKSEPSLDKLRCDKTEPKSMLVKLESNSRSNASKIFLVGAVILGVALVGYAVYSQHFLLFVNHDVQLDRIRTTLSESVHEQQRVIDTVVRIMEHRMNWRSKQKLIALTGPPGVGKTHVANIIKKHFHHSLVKDIFASELTYRIKRDRITSGLNNCCLNLIVIDDIRRSDIVEMIAFLQSLPKEYFILILSIFNFHDTDDLNYEFDMKHVRHVRDSLEDSDLYYEVIIFDHFNDIQVKDWLKKEMQSRNVDENLHHKIINSVLEGHEPKLHGLKGLGAKLSLELEKLKK